jgi:hypothetical protein
MNPLQGEDGYTKNIQNVGNAGYVYTVTTLRNRVHNNAASP